MSNTTNFQNIQVSPQLWLMSQQNVQAPVILRSSNISSEATEQKSELTINSLYPNNTNNYQWYFSNFGNFGRNTWNSVSEAWGDYDGSVGEHDYYVLCSTQSANKIFMTPNGAMGKASFRSLVNADLPVVTYAKGGTGVAAENAYQAGRALYGARTKGDTLDMNAHVTNGFLTNSKKTAYVLITFPVMFYGSPTVSLSGTFTARQNDLYLFGSTSTTPRNLSNVTVSTAISANGWIRIAITGSEQTSAINNHPVCFYFNTLTVTLS